MHAERLQTRRRQLGVTSIEYALIAALIAMVIVLAVTATGANLGSLYSLISGEVAKAAAPAGN